MSRRPPVPDAGPAAVTASAVPPLERDRHVDFLRAFSILVVVLWHWASTIPRCYW